jgi:hypothetical protein
MQPQNPPNSDYTGLFIHSRHESKDFLFREELEDMLRAGALSQLSVCFSRDDAAKYGYATRAVLFMALEAGHSGWTGGG